MNQKIKFFLCLIVCLFIILLHACSKEQSMTIIFDSQGGTPVSSLTYVEGDLYLPPDHPTRDGYTFDGWFLDHPLYQQPFEMNNLFNNSEVSDLVVYAKWIANTYRITYVLNGGTHSMLPSIFTYQEPIEIEDPIHDEKRFSGWFLDTAFEQPFASSLLPPYDITLYAKWSDYIELYPFNQLGCLINDTSCTQTRVGDSLYDIFYLGYRYHLVFGNVRYASDFVDFNSNDVIEYNELGQSLGSAMFAQLIINDTSEDFILRTENARADLTGVTHRIYVTINQDGQVTMIENQIHLYAIYNDGTVESPDWRLTTEEEKNLYDQTPSHLKPATIRYARIRIVIDTSDPDGYRVEPIGLTSWWYEGAPAGASIEDQSIVLEGSPDHVYLPSGWSILSFGTYDRGAANTLTTDSIQSMVLAMITDDGLIVAIQKP